MLQESLRLALGKVKPSPEAAREVGADDQSPAGNASAFFSTDQNRYNVSFAPALLNNATANSSQQTRTAYDGAAQPAASRYDLD